MVSIAGVVLAGGKGTRLNSPTPKVLHRVCGREIVSIVVDAALDSGCAPVSVVVPPDDAPFRAVLGSRVSYATQNEPLGSGHALLQARDVAGRADHVTVFNGDWPLLDSDTATELISHHVRSGATATLLTSRLTPPAGLGRVVRAPGGAVQAVVEEVEAGEEILAIEEVNAGLYCFDGDWVWDAIAALRPSGRKGEIYVTDLISKAVSEGRFVTAIESERPYVNLGVNTREQLDDTEAALRLRDLAGSRLGRRSSPAPVG